MYYLLFIMLFICSSGASAEGMITVSILDFGAKPNDKRSDQEAFEKLSRFINDRGGNIFVKIPSGVYLVGGQTKAASEQYYLLGKNVLSIKDVENVHIEGEKGTKLLFDTGVRFGSFNPNTGLSTSKTFECGKMVNVASERATLGKVINIVNSKNVYIKNLVLDGNFYEETVNNMNTFPIRSMKQNLKYQKDKINIGGGYGDCGIQLEHYGVFILHSSEVFIDKIQSNRFGTDGLMIANVSGVYKNVKVENSTFDYNSRTGIAIGGGEDIKIINCDISNTARFLYIATATGIDIEPEDDAVAKNKSVKNVLIANSRLRGNSEGAILAKFGGESHNVQIINCEIESSRTAVVIGPKSKNFKFFNNKLTGDFILNNKNIGKVAFDDQLTLNNSL